MKEIMRGVEATCRELDIEVMGGHTEVTDVVRQPLISLTGVGKMKKEDMMQPEESNRERGSCSYQMDRFRRHVHCGKGKKRNFYNGLLNVCKYSQRV